MYQDTPPNRLTAASMLRQWTELAGTVFVGAWTALIELGFLAVLAIAPALALIPGLHTNRLTKAADRWAMRLTALELRRLSMFRQKLDTDELTPTGSWRYIAVRWLVGGLGGGVLLMFLLCLTVAASMLSAWIFNGGWGLISNEGRVDGELIAIAVVPGAVILFVTAAGISGVATLDRMLAVHLLGTSTEQMLRRRVETLASTRAQVIDAINDERRRIERDLHDGVQQRLVALGMLIGRARRSTELEHAAELLRQAQAASQDAIADLRGVASRIYPAALDEAGLHVALESLAENASVPIELTFRLPEEPNRSLATVIYFVVSEAVTNATKHAEPALVRIEVRGQGGEIQVQIIDDGPGGANPTGTGLSGLARRVAAADGTFGVHSPAGGPTVVCAHLPAG
ncbi:signal transduction histidine kinase [Kibdelosporangium banguiense]|uniref:histidine kinase n=1 Tax=Kibdelosporangium banguiense TaxID=1365924 RepID=A0ABS4U0R7_9PSEU|nr:histidine kinase [Kibdelosporangium banguiense]MBP2330241.1 signal transduction histidine kinase [Kibdelosporangium banguiense]